MAEELWTGRRPIKEKSPCLFGWRKWRGKMECDRSGRKKRTGGKKEKRKEDRCPFLGWFRGRIFSERKQAKTPSIHSVAIRIRIDPGGDVSTDRSELADRGRNCQGCEANPFGERDSKWSVHGAKVRESRERGNPSPVCVCVYCALSVPVARYSGVANGRSDPHSSSFLPSFLSFVHPSRA